MTETTIPQATDTDATPDRSFYRSDYRRAASVVREARTASSNEVADALASTFVSAFAADAPDFSAELFTASTYPVPAYVRTLAYALRSATRGHDGTPAPESKLAAVDALAASLADTLAPVTPGFDGAKFLASVQPPAPVSYADDDPETDPDASADADPETDPEWSQA